MTLQDDLARHWFQPLDLNGAPHDRARPKTGPVTTHFSGELRLDEPEIASPRHPESPLARVEVTQPYIPAIRDKPPEFARRVAPDQRTTVDRRLNADIRTAAPAAAPPTAGPLEADTTRVDTAAESTGPASEPPPKRRSLMRRVVRKIIGPDLLRKDPAPRNR